MTKADGAYPYILPNPELSNGWRSRWEIEFEPRWRKIGLGYFPRATVPPLRPFPSGARALLETNESVRTIRSLQTQIQRPKETP